MKRPSIALFLFIAATLAWPVLAAAQSAPAGRVEIRDTERRFLASKHVGETFEIDVWLPAVTSRKAPAIRSSTSWDAEYNFGCASYIAKRLIKNGDIPKVLVVGIAYNTDEDDFYAKRDRDSTPPTPLYRHGGAVFLLVEKPQSLFHFRAWSRGSVGPSRHLYREVRRRRLYPSERLPEPVNSRAYLESMFWFHPTKLF